MNVNKWHALNISDYLPVNVKQATGRGKLSKIKGIGLECVRWSKLGSVNRMLRYENNLKPYFVYVINVRTEGLMRIFPC